MTAPVKPALTLEEWAVEAFDDGTGLLIELDGGAGHPALSLWRDAQCEERIARGSGAAHALAALALHGQPFGFTREDVELLRGNLHGGFVQDSPKLWEAMDRLIERIEALLPPDEQ